MVDIDAARQYFASQLQSSTLLPSSAEIAIRADAEHGDATAFYCRWPLIEKGPHSGKYSQEITVLMTAGAINRFRSADPKARGDMATRFLHVFEVRLLEGGYDEKDPLSPPFMVHIDEHSLET